MGQLFVKFVVMVIIGSLAFACGRAVFRLLTGDESLLLASVLNYETLIAGVVIAILTIALNRKKKGA